MSVRTAESLDLEVVAGDDVVIALHTRLAEELWVVRESVVDHDSCCQMSFAVRFKERSQSRSVFDLKVHIYP